MGVSSISTANPEILDTPSSICMTRERTASNSGIFEKKITLGTIIQLFTILTALAIAYSRQEYRIQALENAQVKASQDLEIIKISLIRAGLIYQLPPKQP